MSQFTFKELQTLLMACDTAYRKKDLELRRVRRNKDLIDETFNGYGDNQELIDDIGAMSYDEQVKSAKRGKAEYLQIKNKIKHLIKSAI